jgi:hypothetical protein
MYEEYIEHRGREIGTRRRFLKLPNAESAIRRGVRDKNLCRSANAGVRNSGHFFWPNCARAGKVPALLRRRPMRLVSRLLRQSVVPSYANIGGQRLATPGDQPIIISSGPRQSGGSWPDHAPGIKPFDYVRDPAFRPGRPHHSPIFCGPSVRSRNP